MNYVRRANERGNANFGWLDSHHTFSFGRYHDPEHMGLSALRVINDDTVAPAAGFDTHGHRDMEIISYVLKGAVSHKDSMGNEYIVPAGEVQLMSAGSGVMHSEFNPSAQDPVHFLQIWIEPDEQGASPRYQQQLIEQTDWLTPLVTADGREGSLTMRQDASLFRLMMDRGEVQTISTPGRAHYIHIIDGTLRVNGEHYSAGDGVGWMDDQPRTVSADAEIHGLYFDLPRVPE